MGRLYLAFGLILTTLIILISFLYFFAGGKTYLKVLSKTEINQENRIKTDFFSKEKTDFNSGILAGVIGKRIWFWGKQGLISKKTDENTAYFYRDWCSSEAQSMIKNNEVPNTKAFASLNEWKTVTKAGDYLVIKIATVENGGKLGNLRELRSYNYLPFLEGDINTLCER